MASFEIFFKEQDDDDYNYTMMMVMILVTVAKNCAHGLLAASGPLSKLTPTTCKATRRSKKGPKREEGRMVQYNKRRFLSPGKKYSKKSTRAEVDFRPDTLIRCLGSTTHCGVNPRMIQSICRSMSYSKEAH